MKNMYEIRGDVTAIILNSKKYGELEALISTSKLEKVKQLKGTWYAYPNRMGNFYVRMSFLKDKVRSSIEMHRWITDAPEGMVVDHIDHDTVNNTDGNLRVITNAENQQNRKGPTKGNKTKIRGVYKHKLYDRWEAKIRLNGKVIYLGFYDNVPEAVNAVEEAREKYHKFA